MDSSSLYTYQNLINTIQLRALNTPNAPTAGSTQYDIYENLINNLAIPEWEGQRGVHWDDLWVPVDNAATITAGMSSIALAVDFKEMGGGFVVLSMPGSTTTKPINKPIPVKKLQERVLNPYMNKREFYVSGNRSTGFTLLFGWIPQSGDAEIGAKVSYTYYKYAAILSNSNDVPEMTDPQFIIFRVISEVASLTQNTLVYTTNDSRASTSMANMISANEGAAPFQDDYIKDVDGLLGRGVNSVINRLNSGFWTGSAN